MRNNQNSHTTLTGSDCHFAKRVSNKVKHVFFIWPSNLTFRYLPKWNKNLCSYKNLPLHPNVHSLFICNCQTLQTTKNVPHLGNRQTMECYSTINEILYMQQYRWSSAFGDPQNHPQNSPEKLIKLKRNIILLLTVNYTKMITLKSAKGRRA